MRSCHRSQGRICSEKGEYIPIVKSKEREGTGIHEESVEKEIYPIIKIITKITSALCTEEGWKEEDDTKILILKQLDNLKQLPIATDFGFDR